MQYAPAPSHKGEVSSKRSTEGRKIEKKQNERNATGACTMRSHMKLVRKEDRDNEQTKKGKRRVVGRKCIVCITIQGHSASSTRCQTQ